MYYFLCGQSGLSNVKRLDEENHVDFFDTLDTGDIFLFQSRGIGQRIIRAALRTKWDHVGVVIRRSNYSRESNRAELRKSCRRPCRRDYCSCICDSKNPRLELLEATASGTHVYPLEERLARLALHHKAIAVRKFRGTRNFEGVEDFVSRVRGAPYSWLRPYSYIRLFLFPVRPPKSSRVAPQGISSVSAKRRSIFCTEVCASFLQTIKIVTSEVPPPSRWGPYHFSTDEGRPLLDALAPEAYEEEILIRWQKRQTLVYDLLSMKQEMKKRRRDASANLPAYMTLKWVASLPPKQRRRSSILKSLKSVSSLGK